MRKWKVAIYSTLLTTIPSSALYPQDFFLNVRLHKQKIIRVEEQFPLRTASYDDVLGLIEELESGELETKLNDDNDLDRINQFFAYLARQGVPPGGLEEAPALEHDIAELMGETAYDYQYAVIPAVFNEHGELVLCKSWFKKRWDEAKKFVKKHKKAILIGAAIVIAATVVVAAVVISSGAAGAAVAGAAGAAGAALSEAPSSAPTEGHASPAEEAVMQEAIEEQIAIFRENLASVPFSEPMEEGISLEENGRILGSLLAHEGLKNYKEEEIKSPFGLFLEGIGKSGAFDLLGHNEADSRFATDFAPLYQISEPQGDFNTFFYQARGEKALSSGYLNQAVQDFGKAIDLNPENPSPYLERAVEETLSNPATRESFELFKKAQDFLKPYSKTFLPESEARELIHQAGIRTFPRPASIPDNFRVRISDKGGGMLYVHPTHNHTSIRVMPGKPHSSFPYQQKPYVIQMKNGKIVDKFGNAVAKEAPEAHIPIEEFFYSE